MFVFDFYTRLFLTVARTTINDGRLGVFEIERIWFENWAKDQYLIDGASCWIIEFKKCIFDSQTELFRSNISSEPIRFLSSRSLSSPTYESGVGLDFTFVVDGHQIKASRYVLCENSPVFTAMFANEWKDSRENRIDIEDVSSDAMATFIKILHGVDVGHVAPGIAIEMVVIAEKYQVSEIKKQSAEYAKQHLSNDNVVEALVVAHRLDVKDMKEAALEYMTSKKFGPNLDELTGFDDIPSDIVKLVTQAYRKKLFKL